MKKGLSEVVTVVLLVLLVILAVAILWFFVRPSITENNKSEGYAAECIKLDLDPARCEINPAVPFDAGVNCTTLDIQPINGTSIGDGVIDISDLISGVINSFSFPPGTLCTGQQCLADFNLDNTVNNEDLFLIILNWGTCGGSGASIPDVDGDGVGKYGLFGDTNDTNPNKCKDTDQDTCDDCWSGHFNPYNDNCGDETVGVNIRRNPGGSNITGIKIIYTFPDGSVKVIEKNGSIDTVETSFYLELINDDLGGQVPKEVNVVPVIQDYTCPVKSQAVMCT